MSINRKECNPYFQLDGSLNWKCPTCRKSILKIKAETFHFEQTLHSRNYQLHNDSLPNDIRYVYSCLLECTNPSCKEIVSNTGIGCVDHDMVDDIDGNPENVLVDFFTAKYFSPNLKLFNYPKKIPDNVKDELEKSFALFFCDYSSSGNHMRTALENLLTYLKIKKSTTSNGKRKYLALHNRIELLPRKYQEIQDLLFAIKWLGNAGSHSGKQVTSDDILDAYELMEELLAEVFTQKRENMKNLAKKINRNKGPIKSKKWW
ncbi:MAG: DUF4145 domain-containing protein [Candidatus Nitrohelix vancouverensis]|uniref:DUF4145 domain-containing protein n=1 Tax=Candidatus Nitrohelix vancouverensis TaxID=2705534 RepID=A0A7T0C109_9BACT|nr:MAG: DUF4145 domain-containing protein [Candidatus Nitrohelix vancouverensis]